MEQGNGLTPAAVVAPEKKSWSPPVLTQLGIPSTQSGNFTNINENIFFFFGGMCSDMFVCPS